MCYLSSQGNNYGIREIVVYDNYLQMHKKCGIKDMQIGVKTQGFRQHEKERNCKYSKKIKINKIVYKLYDIQAEVDFIEDNQFWYIII